MEKNFLLESLKHQVDELFQAQISVENRYRFLSSLSMEQLSFLPSLFNEEQKKILIDLVNDLKENESLENIAKGLSSQQFLIILRAIKQNELPIEKLSPLLVGLPPSIFFDVLRCISHPLILTLKLGSSEPLYHQLTLFTHHCEMKNQEGMQTILNLYREIKTFIKRS